MIRPMRDIGANVRTVVGTPTANDSGGTVNGPDLDLAAQGSDGTKGEHSAVLWAQSGVASGTPTTQLFDAKLQDSADGSTYADIVPPVAITQIAADSGVEFVDVDIRKLRRHLRVVSTVAFTGGTTPAWPVSTMLVLAGARVLPQS